MSLIITPYDRHFVVYKTVRAGALDAVWLYLFEMKTLCAFILLVGVVYVQGHGFMTNPTARHALWTLPANQQPANWWDRTFWDSQGVWCGDIPQGMTICFIFFFTTYDWLNTTQTLTSPTAEGAEIHQVAVILNWMRFTDIPSSLEPTVQDKWDDMM